MNGGDLLFRYSIYPQQETKNPTWLVGFNIILQ